MAREAAPVVNLNSPQNFQIDAKWHHSHLMQDHMNFEIQSRLARQEGQQRKFAEAARMYSTLLQSPKNRAGNYLSRGKCFLMLRRFDLALSDFTNSISLEPQDGDAYRARSEAYQQLGQTEKAQADLAQSMKLNR
jgi:tetratricopeptide (TPR) repeat protein